MKFRRCNPNLSSPVQAKLHYFSFLCHVSPHGHSINICFVTWWSLNGKMMSMNRMKYFSTDFLVYQLSERKVIFLNTRHLDCFWKWFKTNSEKRWNTELIFLFVPRTTIRQNQWKVKSLLEGNISCETTHTSILPTFIKRKNTWLRLKR